MKIIQIVVGKTEYKGKTYNEVTGLGDDSNIYKWHTGQGKWLLNRYMKNVDADTENNVPW